MLIKRGATKGIDKVAAWIGLADVGESRTDKIGIACNTVVEGIVCTEGLVVRERGSDEGAACDCQNADSILEGCRTR